MPEHDPDDPYRTLVRRFVGRPPVWLACLWLAAGVGWLGLGIATAGAFDVFIGSIWLVCGLAMLVVALRDRARRRR